MCECHQPTEQYQLVDEKIEEEVVEEHGILNNIMGCSPFPTIGEMEEVDPHGV
jgi:hypothetical protein